MKRYLKAGEKLLLNHPFYKDWESGRLSERDLAIYSAEYEHFIKGILPLAWKELRYNNIYEEELEHAELWKVFGNSVNYTPTKTPQTDGMKRLIQKFNSIKHNKPSLIGFLYAFEHQQPEVSKSKLQGLEKWFNIPDKGKEYFLLHARNTEEKGILENLINSMNNDEFSKCEETFEETINILWDVLTDIQNLCLKG
ncbi:MAG: iron-containing redox enzyme family protein [candidate division WOR-3 bacterium]